MAKKIAVIGVDGFIKLILLALVNTVHSVIGITPHEIRFNGDAKKRLRLKLDDLLQSDIAVITADIHHDQVVSKIEEADVIILSFGEFSKLLDFIKTPTISSAISRSNARVVYVSNLMTHFNRWAVDVKISDLNQFIKVDTVILASWGKGNPDKDLSAALMAYFQADEDVPMDFEDPDCDIIIADLIAFNVLKEITVFQHDIAKLSDVLVYVIER